MNDNKHQLPPKDNFKLVEHLKEKYPSFNEMVRKKYIINGMLYSNWLAPHETVNNYKELKSEDIPDNTKTNIENEIFVNILKDEVEPYLDTLETELQKKIELLMIVDALCGIWNLNFENITEGPIRNKYNLRIDRDKNETPYKYSMG